MAHSVTVGYRSLLAAIVVLGIVPNALGSADEPPRRAPVERVANPIAMLFGALSRCREELSERERWRIAGAIHQESQRYGYDPLFILAMVEVESTCSPKARSHDGAVGLIQVKPSIARAVAEEAGLRWRGAHTLTQPTLNLHLGLRYLTQLERRFRDPRIAVAAFNLGPKRVARMSRAQARHTHYVRKVLARYEDLLVRHATRDS